MKYTRGTKKLVRQVSGSDREKSQSSQEAKGDSKGHYQKDGTERVVNLFLFV